MKRIYITIAVLALTLPLASHASPIFSWLGESGGAEIASDLVTITTNDVSGTGAIDYYSHSSQADRGSAYLDVTASAKANAIGWTDPEPNRIIVSMAFIINKINII